MKVCTIVGARPQFIKAAAVFRAIDAHNRFASDASYISQVVIHTGQHYDDGMSAVFFRELEMPEPSYNLGIGSCSHGRQTGEMLAAIEEALIREQPDWVLVHGDTNSTLAGALAGAKLHIPIAHVEAGLRSFNRYMPEEINRVVTDHLSSLLFCPSRVSADNLAVEGITKGVSIVGDVMADALRFAVERLSMRSNILETLVLQPKGYFLATVHRAENTDNPERLRSIMSVFCKLACADGIILPLHPRTRKILGDAIREFPSGLKIVDPVGYFDMIALEKSARAILTDSGGVQKEAYWLKVPCITLRDETEWLETVDTGWNILTGTDEERILNAVHNLTWPTDNPSVYGNGHAAEEIIKTVLMGYTRV